MTDHRPFTDDLHDAAWRAFAEADVRVKAPPDLERRVLEAVQRAPTPRLRAHQRASTTWMAAAAAIILAFGFGFGVGRALDGLRPHRAVARDVPAIANPPRSSHEPSDVAMPPPAGDVRDGLSHNTSDTVASREARALQFASDPRHATESLQMLRVRLRPEVLRTLGIRWTDDGLNGLIDVDVVIGEDGLPREVRPVRTERTEQE